MGLQSLTPEKKRQLAVLLGEAKKRGLTIPSEMDFRTQKGMSEFKLAENGYWPKYFTGTFYNPKPYHEEFIRSNALYTALIGSRGCGKSSGGAQKANYKIMQGESGMVLNPDFENFKISTWPEFREWIPWNMVVPRHRYMMKPEWQPSKPFKITFMNGVNVLCKGLKDADSARGPNCNWLWYDEAQRDQTGRAFQIAIACVRIGKNPQSWVTATPTDVYSWLYKFFEEKDIPEDAMESYKTMASDRPMIDVWYGTLEENKENLSPEFVTSILMAYPVGYLRTREVDGRFANEGGSLGDAHWFDGHMLDAVPEEPDELDSDGKVKPKTGYKTIRYWDLAASERKVAHGKKLNDPDETVGTLLTWNKKQDFFIENQEFGHWKWEDIKLNVKRVAEKDGPGIKIYIEQEPGSGGKNQVAELAKYLKEELGSAWHVEMHNPRDQGDKVMRANPWFGEASAGHFWMVRGTWNRETLSQLAAFPTAPHDDRIDSISGARAVIAPYKLWKSIQFIHL